MYGATLSTFELILGLRRQYGIEPLVLIPNKGGIEEFLTKEGINYEVKYFPWWVTCEKLKFKDLIKFFVYNLYNYYKLIYKSIKKHKIDYVYSNSAVINTGVVLAKFLKVKHIWHLREFVEEDFGLKYYYPKWYVKWFFKQSDICISVSNAVKNIYKKKYPKINIVNIYNGLKNSIPKRRIEIETGNCVNFCCVGAICYHKNQLEILKALSLLKNKTRRFKLFLIGGGDANYISQLKDYASANDLSEQIIFLGYRKDINTILQDMHVGIMTSRCEAFGRVTVEYMAASMPVIAADTGGSPEIVRDNVSGYIYQLGDYEAMARIMEHLIDTPEEIGTLGANGYDIAHESFTIEKNIDNIYKVLSKELNK